jgi:general secretion pathway protein J
MKKAPNQSCSIKGYTLMEVLIALSVFAILTVVTSTAMYNAYNTRARVNEQADKLNSLQLAMTVIGRDTKQIIERTIKGEDMVTIPAYIGDDNYTEFTRDGMVNPNSSEKRSTLKRVAYLCRDEQLIRRSWAVLDSPKRKQYNDKILLDNLFHCSMSYITRSRQILDEWRAGAVQQNQKKEPLPVALQLDLNIKNWGKMQLRFIIPEALYGQ